MSPALQAQIDLLAASDAENPLCLERALGGAAGVQLATLSEALASVDLDLVATLPPALQDILNTALNSTSTNPLCLERELGGAAGVQLAILAAIMASGGGGGGGDFLPLAGGTMDTDADIAFDNGSRIHQTPGANGIDQVCSIDYVHRWSNGLLYILDQSNRIRVVKYGMSLVPDSSYDSTLGFMVGSIFEQDGGNRYICTDATAAAAVWVQIGPAINPGVAYIQTNGNNATAQLGNPARPFRTIAHALSHAESAGQSHASLNLGRGTFNGDAMLTSTLASIFLSGESPQATIVTASWVGADGVVGADGDPAGNGTAGESFDGCPALLSDKSMGIYIYIRGGGGNTGGANTSGGGVGGSGGNGGNVAGISLSNIVGTLEMLPGALGTGGYGDGGNGLDGVDGAVGDTNTMFCAVNFLGFSSPALGVHASIINDMFISEIT
jgi:hypothetical protein